MKSIEKFMGKRKREAALKELRKRILKDSLLIKTPKNADKIDVFSTSKLDTSTFILYPIALNKSTKYSQYIHASLSPDNQVTTPLTWETIEFIKEELQLDLEKIHKVGFDLYNDGTSTRPFHQCHSILTLSWKETGSDDDLIPVTDRGVSPANLGA